MLHVVEWQHRKSRIADPNQRTSSTSTNMTGLYVHAHQRRLTASHYHHLAMSEVMGMASLYPICVSSIFRSRPGSREVMGREKPNLKATDSSLLQSGSPPRGTRVRIRPEGMVHVSTGSGGHMMSEVRTPFSVCPCREDSQQQELSRPVKPRVGVVLGGLKRQREEGGIWGSHSEIRQTKLRSVAPGL